MVTRLRNSRGRFAAASPIDVRSEAQIPQLLSLLSRGPSTFVLVYADWCGHCQHYKPMWQKLTHTPGRIANMAAVRDDIFPKVARIKDAKIQGYPSVIKVSPDGSIERYNMNGETTNAIDSSKMRDMAAMRKEITTVPRSFMASNMASIAKTPAANAKLNMTTSIAKEIGTVAPTTAASDDVDIYTPVTSMRGVTSGSAPGSLLTEDERREVGLQNGGALQSGGGLSVAAAFASAVQSVGPAALLLAAHSLLPKSRRTYRSPKRSSHRGGTRRLRR